MSREELERVEDAAELRSRIEDPERFRPIPKLLVEPRFRETGQRYRQLYVPADDRWMHVHALQEAALRAFHETDDLAAAVRAAKPHCKPSQQKYAERFVRSFFQKMTNTGIIDIPKEVFPEVFAHRYRLVRELGRGGVGVVLLYEDTERDGELVTVKRATGWSKPIERTERNIRLEARALARLDHPRIPGLVEAVEEGGLLHIVRAYAPGQHLGRAEPCLHERESGERLNLLRGCAEALQHVHDRGMLYLDVKPANFIMNGGDEGPFLVDVGLCHDLGPDGLVRLKKGVGTRGFAAPEMVQGHVVGPSADVFGLGRTFARLATGQKFRYKDQQKDVAAALDAHGIPDPERALLVDMCADDPAARPQTMKDVLARIP